MKPIDEDNWQWGPAWRGLRDDVNTLAWLLAEQTLWNRALLWLISGADPSRMHEIDEPWHGKASSPTNQAPA